MRMLTTTAGRILGVMACLVCAATAAEPGRATPPDKLGQIDFPTSCTKEAQPELEKGVALLHSFQYTEAETNFTEAVKRDPKCAIGYWGQAMSRYHQLWEFPDDKTLKEGRQDIEKAKKLRVSTPNEQAFINSAIVFFQNKKLTHAERIQGYSTELVKAYERRPDEPQESDWNPGAAVNAVSKSSGSGALHDSRSGQAGVGAGRTRSGTAICGDRAGFVARAAHAFAYLCPARFVAGIDPVEHRGERVRGAGSGETHCGSTLPDARNGFSKLFILAERAGGESTRSD